MSSLAKTQCFALPYLMQCFKKDKNKLRYLLAILYLEFIFIQLTSVYFWCELFIVFLIICSEFVDAFVL